MIPTFARERTSHTKESQRKARSVIVHSVECGPRGRRLVKTSVEHRGKVYLNHYEDKLYIPSAKKGRWSISNLLRGGAK